MRGRIIGALETGCRLGEMLEIQIRHVMWETHQNQHSRGAHKGRRLATHSVRAKRTLGKAAQASSIPRLESVRIRRPDREYQDTIRTAWESLVLLAHGVAPTRTRAHGRVNREQLTEIDLHSHDLRHEAACRWRARGLDLRAIQLLLGHADLKTTQRYLNVTDEELRRAMTEKLWSGRTAQR